MKRFAIEAEIAVEADVEAAFDWYEGEESGLGVEPNLSAHLAAALLKARSQTRRPDPVLFSISVHLALELAVYVVSADATSIAFVNRSAAYVVVAT